jgi:RNA polymerase sigma-70 factor (ECF subfamily)
MANPEQLLLQARAGDAAPLGQLLELCRRYLALLARLQISPSLKGKVDASDLVRETFREAHRNFAHFRGTSEAQFVQWLRQILAAKLAELLRRYLGTTRRDAHLERDLEDALDRSSVLLHRGLVLPPVTSQPRRREQAVLLADALEQLSEEDREVLVLRHLEGLTFPGVAQRMGRKLESVEKLWLRALARLRQRLGDLHEPDGGSNVPR